MLHEPATNYSGLTIILDKPSRHDKKRLISGYVGDYFDNFLHPVDRFSCEIRTLDEKAPIRPNTKTILGLGEGCVGTLCTNKYSLNEIRGYPLSYQGYPLILSYAPQDAFDRKDYFNEDEEGENQEDEGNTKTHGRTRRRNWRWWMMQDIRRAVKCLKLVEDDLNYIPDTEYFIGANTFGLIDFLKNLKGYNLFLDIEINKNKKLTCIGLGVNKISKRTIIVIPWITHTGEYYYPKEFYYSFIQALTIAMHNNTVVVHNAMFDLFVLCYYYKIPFPSNVFDTMIAWHRCYPELEKSLGHLLSYLTWLPYHKSDGVYNPKTLEESNQLWNYNAQDILAMMHLLPALQDEIRKLKVENSVAFANSMIRPYLIMMYKGMKLDTEKMTVRFFELMEKRIQLDRCVATITSKNINPRSHKQVAEYLYCDLGFDCPNENAPTNEKTLLKLLLKHNIPSVKLILEGRATSKTAGSLKYNLYKRPNEDKFQRLTTAYGLANTDTFRLASKALLKFRPDKGFGTNVQNIDKKQRDLVISDYCKDRVTRKVLIQADQSGAEALIVAYLSKPGILRELFISNIKIHSYVALHIFKEVWKSRFLPTSVEFLCQLNPYELACSLDWLDLARIIKSSDEWPAKERYYFIAKMIVHASNYDMKAPTFQMNVLQKSDGAIALSRKECEAFLGFYHNLFPEIRQWHAEIRRTIDTTRVLYNLFGEARRFMEPKGEELYRQAYAFIPQSTVGEITNRAIVKLQQSIDDKWIGPAIELDLLQNGHDSILSQAHPVYKNEAILHLRNALTPTLEVNGTKFKMGCEVAAGYNWGPYHEKKNPEGLQEVK